MLPERVMVGPIGYRVVRDQAAIDRVGQEARQVFYGHSNHVKQVITVMPEMGPDQEADTLLHEVLHCCFRQSADVLTTEEEEKLVLTLSPVLLTTLRANPLFVAYLTQEGC